MNISSQGFANQYTHNLQTLQTNNLHYMNQIGSGHKFQTPSEAPSDASVVLRAQTSRMQISQCLKNGSYANGLANIASQTIEKMMEVNSDIGAYSVQYSSLNTDALEGIRSTIDGLLEQMVDLGNSKQMDTFLFGGTKLTQEPFDIKRDPVTHRITKIDYVGGNDANTFSIGPNLSLNPLTEATENKQIKTALDNLLALRNAFYEEPPDSDKIRTLGNIVNQNNETIFSDIMGTLGAKLTRIEHAEQQNQFINEDLEKISSHYADINIADVMVKFQQSQFAYQAALQTGSKVLNLSLLNYL